MKTTSLFLILFLLEIGCYTAVAQSQTSVTDSTALENAVMPANEGEAVGDAVGEPINPTLTIELADSSLNSQGHPSENGNNENKLHSTEVILSGVLTIYSPKLLMVNIFNASGVLVKRMKLYEGSNSIKTNEFENGTYTIAPDEKENIEPLKISINH